MKPRLYKANETAFTNRGIGTLSDAILCDVTEVRNGEYELELEFPMSGKYYEEIQMQRYILASPGPGKIGQPFEIYDISKPMNGVVSFKGRHISYKLNKVTVKPFTASSCTQALQALKTNSVNANPFTFWTNKSVTGTMNVKVPQQLRGLLGGQQGSILDTYGTGEYEWDRFTVRLWQHRGADRGVTIRYGKNLLDLTDEGDMGSVYTGIVPYYSGNEALVMLPELVLYGEHRDDYSYDMVIPVDLSSSFSGSETPTAEQLRQAAQKYLEKSEAWQIRSNIKINFVNLADTEEYRNVAALQRVDLCDTVTVIHEGLGVSAKAKVVKTVYDVLNEKYKEIELGSTQTSLSEAITETILEEVPTFDFMQEAIRNGTALITGGLGGYVVLKLNANGKPEELLVMDTDDIATATNAWRFNKNGIGFSPNGYNGPYKQAWTIDGAFYTDWVTTGRMTAGLIKVGTLSALNASGNYWNMESGEFRMTSDGATNGIIYKNGILSIDASSINVGTLSADRIGANSIAVSKLTGKIENGNWKIDLDAGTFTIGNISANNINTGTLSADRIAANSIGVSKLTGKIEKEEVAGGTKWIIDLDNGTMQIGTLSANLIKTGTLQSPDGSVEINLDNGTCDLNGSFSTTDIVSGKTYKIALKDGNVRFYLNDTYKAAIKFQETGWYEDATGRAWPNIFISDERGGGNATFEVSVMEAEDYYLENYRGVHHASLIDILDDIYSQL